MADHGARRLVLCVIGTRPEAIKMAPVVRALGVRPGLRPIVLKTGQHDGAVDEILETFGIEADFDLGFLSRRAALERAVRELSDSIAGVLAAVRPGVVLVQGDTTSALAGAWASRRRGVLLGHVEAGLRSGNLRAPFPEEANRVVIAQLAALHFAPTAEARENLLREGIEPASIWLTGNTVIDALRAVSDRLDQRGESCQTERRTILVTAHRRDSWGAPLERICRAVAEIHDRYPDVEIRWPLHPNPCVAETVTRALGALARVRLTGPLPYLAFVAAMKQAALILTDSGGIQEEAPALGKPVLVLREETERPEVLALGVARLVGRDPERIVHEVSRLLEDESAYARMARGGSPYGDGQAAQRIARISQARLDGRDGFSAAVQARITPRTA